MKVIRTIVIEGNPSWVKRTLRNSYLSPGEGVRYSWHQSIVEINRELSGELQTDDEFYAEMQRQPAYSIEDHDKD